MYAVAARLDPDRYFALARAVYAEMVLAGMTAVGEFHYLHHGHRRAAVRRPERDGRGAGRGRGGGRHPAHPARRLLPQRRADRARPSAARPGAAAVQRRHRRGLGRPGRRLRPATGADTSGSGRPCTRSARCRARTLRRSLADRGRTGPLHVHLSEQPAENAACQAFYGCTPDRAAATVTDLLGPSTTAVHATHLTACDIAAARRHRRPASASARPPSATWPTASARPARCATPAARSRLGSRPARGDRPVRGAARAGAARAADQPRSAAGSRPAELIAAASRAATAAWAGPAAGRLAVGRSGRPGGLAAGIGPHRRRPTRPDPLRCDRRRRPTT